MFNVDWNAPDKTDMNYGTLYGGVYKQSYPAMSYDYMTGLRYRPNTSWTISSGVVYLSEAQTDNPMERGQSNTLTIGNAGVSYNDLYPGLTGIRWWHHGSLQAQRIGTPLHARPLCIQRGGFKNRYLRGSNRYTSALCLLRVASNLFCFAHFWSCLVQKT